jgi:hypothetical protein
MENKEFDFIEINKSEYERQKEKNYKYTARQGFKYYKLQRKFPVELGNNNFKIKISEDRNVYIEYHDGFGFTTNILFIGSQTGERFKLLKEAIEIIKNVQ